MKSQQRNRIARETSTMLWNGAEDASLVASSTNVEVTGGFAVLKVGAGVGRTELELAFAEGELPAPWPSMSEEPRGTAAIATGALSPARSIVRWSFPVWSKTSMPLDSAAWRTEPSSLGVRTRT